MEKLPPELQLYIVDGLSATDIIRFQQSCKRFHSLVTTSPERVWRRCLERQCRNNNVFRPSYTNLLDASALRKACTGARRLARAFNKAISSDSERSEGVIEGNSIKFPETEVVDMFLVPGGRFLLTVDLDSLFMWDLDSRVQIDDKHSQPTLVLQHRVGVLKSLAHANVIDNTQIRILLYSADPSDGNPHFICEVLEIKSSENALFSLQKVGEIKIASPFYFSGGRPGHGIVLEDTAIICLRSLSQPHRKVLVWDYKRSLYCEIGLDEVGKVFLSQMHLFWVNPEGLFAFKLQDFQPIQDARIAVFPSTGANTPPAFADLHEDPNFTTIIRPSILRPFSIDEPLIYYTMQADEGSAQLRQYHFFFNALDPEASKLKLVESSTCAFPLLNHGWMCLDANQYHLCGDQPVILWEDSVTGLPSLSLSPPVVKSSVHSAEETIETKFSLLLLEHALYHQGNANYKIDICPSSGRAVRFWKSGYEGVTHVEMYDFQ